LNLRFPIGAAALAAFFLLPAALADEEIENALRELKSPSPEVRVSGLRDLMTSLDPRIPDAVLPLLRDEGDSIRRLAARALGSRWWQIPEESRAEILRALEPNLRSPHEDERQMAVRAVGLISRQRTAREPVFSLSPNKRWLVYERRGLPCIIDTENDTEELVGWEPLPESYISYCGSHWHPRIEMLAVSVGIGRHHSAIWIWRPGKPLLKLDKSDLEPLLGGNLTQLGLDNCSVKSWKGRDLLVDYTYEISKDEEYEAWTARFQWSPETGRLRLLRKAPST
jgi:hypothetical protein